MNTQTQEEYIKKIEWALRHIKPATRNIDPIAWDTIEKALATNEESLLVQPAQESVEDTLICASKILVYLGYSQSESLEPSADKRRDKIADIIANFYTHPAPPKEPLSDEELSLMAWNDCSDDWNDLGNRKCWLDGYEAGARAIEKAHGIGEQA